ncbi:MAG: D-sedoheptulose 7-phosphate isomerase [Candidatus Competibacteraceae bacterium]|nr:D-sedoheptulose 7-phosphate isomerase [Candidatus Competibacteraceae bacterium]
MDISTQMRERARAHLLESAETKHRVAGQCLESLVRAAQLLTESFAAGGKLLLCGNGGSAADCQHIAAEFVSTLTQDFRRPGLKAIALTTDTSFLTAYTNDFGYEGVFARQVETFGAPGDTLIGISTSGNSKNVLNAMEVARKIGLRTIGLAGSGGQIHELADIVIGVPSKSTQHIQEAHITIGHILCDLVERCLFDGKQGGTGA